MDSVYNTRYLSVICCCEFDIVVDADSVEGEEGVSSTQVQCMCPKSWIIDTSNKVS